MRIEVTSISSQVDERRDRHGGEFDREEVINLRWRLPKRVIDATKRD
jgi:predicted secreted Zn-dependent protease